MLIRRMDLGDIEEVVKLEHDLVRHGMKKLLNMN